MAIGILAVIGFNLVDTFFVSQLGTKELAAISLTFPVISTLQSITMGLGAGLSSVVSRLKGAGRIDELRSIITHSLFTIGLVTVFAILGLLSIDPLFTAIGASYDLLPLVHEYMEIWYFGIGFLVIPMMGNAAIRGLGDAKISSFNNDHCRSSKRCLRSHFNFYLGFSCYGTKRCSSIHSFKYDDHLFCCNLYIIR